MTEIIRTPGQSSVLPGAVRAGNLILTSGAIGTSVFATLRTEERTPFPQQAAEALAEVIRHVEDAGGTKDTILRIEVFLASKDFYPAWNAEFQKVWPEPGPARSVAIVELANPAILIELHAVAVAAE
ncbi:RidA family protein [Salinibacterium sp. ZJ454]|uniref:RidA family protein n=1 Tax=Salinibacterium sp. ZJ454 TaxID=2708339 RepID=UPI00141FAD66|nr:RidA family protein [Salinibacterium sp. ZJ454]